MISKAKLNDLEADARLIVSGDRAPTVMSAKYVIALVHAVRVLQQCQDKSKQDLEKKQKVDQEMDKVFTDLGMKNFTQKEESIFRKWGRFFKF